ncbi:hypothetical protein GCM10010277_47790 [Streptomyces longisporoflavus]|nr:hypothetical protein GCM10010277_47790 [Streptomyces longisporoflavus]
MTSPRAGSTPSGGAGHLVPQEAGHASRLAFRRYENGGGGLPGDQDLFDGSLNQLRRFARGQCEGGQGGTTPRRPGFRAAPRRSGRPSTGARRNRSAIASYWVTARPDPVHFPFTLLAYVPLATDVQQKPG